MKGIKSGLSRFISSVRKPKSPNTIPPFRYTKEYPNATFLEYETNLIKNMKQLTNNSITKLNDEISVVNLGMKLDINSVSSDLLFVRDFYPSLLEDIRKNYRAILLGNPGISKSFFHYYYLARIINTSLFGSLPIDYYGSTNPPEIVVRQICGEAIQVYDISNETVYQLLDTNEIFTSLENDDQKSLYLMEPGTTVKREPYLKDVPTLITVSPDTSRYYQFQKNGGVYFYMPCYTEQELLTIGNYLRGNKDVNPPIPSRLPEGMDEEYTEESLKNRFKQFGGIIRHVLPLSTENLDDTKAKQKQAIREVIKNNQAVHILSSSTIEDKKWSHFIAQYQVPIKTEGNKIRFRKPTLEITSQDIRDQLVAELGKFSIQDKIDTLISNDNTNSFKGLIFKLFEKLFTQMIISENGITCQQQELKLFKSGEMPTTEKEIFEKKYKASPESWKPYTLKLPTLVEGPSPPYSDMECDTLYYPTIENHSFCEFFYKDRENGTLVVFQLTRQISGPKYITQSAFTQFLKSIKFPKDQISKQFKLIFVPGPNQAETMSIVVKVSENKKLKEKGKLLNFPELF